MGESKARKRDQAKQTGTETWIQTQKERRKKKKT